MKSVKYIGIALAMVLSLGFSGCGESGGSSENIETSKFDLARQMNLSELENYDLVTGDSSGATNLRNASSQDNSQQTTQDSSSLKLINIFKDTIDYSIQNVTTKEKSINLRSTTVNGDIATYVETENGNISGTKTINFEMNTVTGKMTGNMTYINYKNSESNSCAEDEIDNLNGIMNVTGIFNISTYDLKAMTINLDSDFSMDDMIWKSGASMTVVYNQSSYFDDDSLMTMTIEVINGSESIGFKNYKIRSYNNNGYEYSYPVEGNIYIFTNDINGYFSVDTTYDHSLTPTKEDWCGKYTYSGQEKYIGKDSSLIWEITSTNNYQIRIDSNNDGITDINKTGTVGN